jgi:hypothetical protein
MKGKGPYFCAFSRSKGSPMAVVAAVKARRWLKAGLITCLVLAGWFATSVMSYHDDTRLDAKVAQSR